MYHEKQFKKDFLGQKKDGEEKKEIVKIGEERVLFFVCICIYKSCSWLSFFSWFGILSLAIAIIFSRFS